jgi:hypothetical protein
MAVPKAKHSGRSTFDQEQMIKLVRFTERTLTTDTPVPFGAMVISTRSREMLVRAVNQAAQKNKPDLPRGSERHQACLQEDQESSPPRVHSLHHL